MSVRYAHALIIGGSGMLREASVAIAHDARAVTAIASTEASLEALGEAMEGSGARYWPAALDYRNLPALRGALKEAVARYGPIDMVLAWIHSDAEGAIEALASAAAPGPSPADFFHVLGSAAAGPEDLDRPLRDRLSRWKGLDYREVILGFVVEDGQSRWLSHAEICAGVIAAIITGEKQVVIGQVEPWSERP